MKGVLSLALGVMTAIGGFVDIGNLVTSGITGGRFGMSLTWAIVLGTIGMTIYGEMAGRVTAVSARPVFHVVRERLGVRFALVNLAASLLLTVLTLAAEIAGVALTFELASTVNYLLFVPLVAFFVWLVVWRLPFSALERVFGLLGLALLVYVVALFKLPTDWAALGYGIIHPTVPSGEGHPTWFFYAVSLIGACLVPYQVFFFSSGGLEEGWTPRSLGTMRLNAVVGFPLGGALSIAIMAAAVPTLQPLGINVSHLGQIGLPVVAALGKIGLGFVLVGFFAAAAECTLSSGYIVAQYFGWSWGKWLRPNQAPRFHVVCLLALVLATGFILTTVDPVQLTIVSVVLGAAAIPLTFFPILVIANDRDYMGKYVNKRWLNAVATVFFVGIVVMSVATLPLALRDEGGPVTRDDSAERAGWPVPVADANDLLLDRQIFDVDGQPVGKVDDVEMSDPAAGSAPLVTAILCGPTALGPRIGDRVGTYWAAIGRRLRPRDDPYPVRIPFSAVATLDRRELTLQIRGDDLGTFRLRDWTRDKIVGRIPGSGT